MDRVWMIPGENKESRELTPSFGEQITYLFEVPITADRVRCPRRNLVDPIFLGCRMEENVAREWGRDSTTSLTQRRK